MSQSITIRARRLLVDKTKVLPVRNLCQPTEQIGLKILEGYIRRIKRLVDNQHIVHHPPGDIAK